MDRKKLIDAILEKVNVDFSGVRLALQRMPDADLVVYANEIGINTDALLEVK